MQVIITQSRCYYDVFDKAQVSGIFMNLMGRERRYPKYTKSLYSLQEPKP